MREKSGKGKTIWVNSIFLSLIYSLFSYLLYHVFPYEMMTGELFLTQKTWNIPKTQLWSCLDHETCILFEQYLTHLIIMIVLGMFESIPRCLESQKVLRDSKDIHGLVDMTKDMLCGWRWRCVAIFFVISKPTRHKYDNWITLLTPWVKF